jgi:hypothetical protein
MTSNKAPRKMPKTEKTCQFPGCSEKFMGIGAAKYCEEHRKPEYRKVINEMRAKEKKTDTNFPERSNLIIKHDNTTVVEKTLTCPCGADYIVSLYPNIDIYPKFCEKHRNPYQRDMLLKKLGLYKDGGEEVEHIEIDDIDISDINELNAEFEEDLFEIEQLEE